MTMVPPDPGVRRLKRTQVCFVTVFFVICVKAIDRGPEILGAAGFKLLDLERYGIAGFLALLAGPALYFIFRAIYRDRATPSGDVGNETLALEEAGAAGGTV